MLRRGGGGRARLEMGEVGLDPSVDPFALILQARRKMAQIRRNPRTA